MGDYTVGIAYAINFMLTRNIKKKKKKHKEGELKEMKMSGVNFKICNSVS